MFFAKGEIIMNNIYKVIWSKAKNCYVVASEIARSHTKSASGSEKIGGVTRRSLLASLMALSLLCGGLGVASAADDVSVAESTAPGAVEVYTKTGVNTLLDGKANTSLDNLSDAGKAVIKTTMTDELAKKADATALDGKANTSLDNLSEAGKSVIKTTMAGELANKADATAVTTLEGRVGGVEGKVTALETTVGDASSGLVKDVNDLNTAIGTKANQSDLVAATNRITANEGNITELQRKTTNIDYDVANQTTSINGMKVGQQVDMGGKDITNARALTATGKVTGDGVDAGTGAITGGSLTVTGKVTGNGVDAGAGDITTTGNVKGGTLEATGNATIGGALTATGKVTGDGVDAGTGAITGGSLTVTGKVTGNGVDAGAGDITTTGNVKGGTLETTGDATIGGDLKVTGTITTDKMVFGDKATNNYTEIDKGHITSKNDVLAGDATKKSSSMELDHSKLEVGVADKDSNGHLTMTADQTSIKNSDLDGKNYSEIVADKDSVKTTVKDEKDNTTSTKSSATEIRNYAKDKDGNESSIVQTGKDITNTAEKGTITNTAKDIVNNATGDMKNDVGGKLTTTVAGQATENFNGGLNTTVNGAENHTVTGKQINTVGGGQENIISGGQINNITGDQTTTISGTQTTTATDIKRNASSGMIDTIDNDYGTNTETKVAGKTTTDVSIKGTGEKGQYIRGANESRDYLIKGTLKNSETKTVEKTSTEITDGTNKASTIQDAKNLAGSVTNGTETGVSGIHANDDGSVSIDSGVTDGTNTSVQKQTASAIATDVKDGAGNENASVATATTSANTIKSGSKANTVISTADGTSFINSEAAAPVTGASGAGTAVNTTIKGNTITTGKVTMDYAEVMKDLGVHGNAKVDQNLEVGGTSTLKGDVTMESNATVKKDLKVEGTTTTQTLKVTENAEIDGTLKVAKKATFEDSVSIAKDLSVGGDVTANSYKVGDKTYIDANGIHANGQKITDVADGSISEGSKDAVNGGQLYGVKRDLEHQVDKVGANAAAMANLRPMEFDPSSKWNIAAAIGNYGSETAAALGAFYRPNDDVMVNLSTAFGTGENMVGGGVSVRLGKSGNKLSREENNALKAQVDDLTARMDALLSVLNPNMSKDFPDVPENHWAYEAVSRLAGNDIVQGYPDGEFHGERTMTRYEMAEIIYNALSRGAEAERELVEEFKPELQAMAASEKATAEKAEG